MVNITVDPRQMAMLQRAVAHIKDGVPKVLVPAINRALAKGKTEVSREIRKEYVIKHKDIPIEVHKANKMHLGGSVDIEDGMLPLNKFKVRPASVQKRKHKQMLWAQVRRGQGGFIPPAFVAATDNYTGPFVRAHGVGRLPIVKLLAISAPIMASQPKVGPVVNKAMGDTLAKRIDHEILRVMSREGHT